MIGESGGVKARLVALTLPIRNNAWLEVPKSILRGSLSLLFGAALLVVMGSAATALSKGDLPSPAATFQVFWELVSDPFYRSGPNDQGIGLQLWSSLQRVLGGFALGSAVGIPFGIIIGANPFLRRLVDPVVQVLRPVSPLAWFPVGLATFHGTAPATLFVIFITSLWPTVINTAFGVSSIPESYKQVARVFGFSRSQYLTKVVLPYSLPHILTGMRLSMGIAWLVIVAAEKRVMSAILVIGLMGLVLDRVFSVLGDRFAYKDA